MTIKPISPILLPLAIALVLQWSCAPDIGNESKEEAYSYPLSVGNSWKYDFTLRSENYRKRISDSTFVPMDTVVLNDSLTELVTVDHLDSTTVDAVTMVVRDSEWNSASVDTTKNAGTSWTWYRNNTDGLYVYAYNSAGHGALPKKAITKGFRYKGIVFAKASLLSAYFIVKANSYLAKTLSALNFPNVYPTPRKILLYPYSADTLWEYNPDDTTARIARKYLGKEKVTCKAGTFACYKVQWLWDWDLDGIWDDDREQVDWISPLYGLIKRFFRSYDIEQIDSAGSVTGKFDWVQEYQATEISINGH